MSIFVRVLLFTGGMTLYFGGLMGAAYIIRRNRIRRLLKPANDPVFKLEDS